MNDSTNPRVMADNIKELSALSGSQAADISTLQGDVKTLGDAIEAIGSYSTTEVNTGMKYGDDDIYRKCFYVEALPNTTTSTVSHGIENIGYLLDLRLAIQRSGAYPGRVITYTQSLNVVLRTSDIAITSNADLSGNSGIIILEYTKAAPAPTPDVTTSPDPDTRSLEEPETEPEEPEPIEEKK